MFNNITDQKSESTQEFSSYTKLLFARQFPLIYRGEETQSNGIAEKFFTSIKQFCSNTTEYPYSTLLSTQNLALIRNKVRQQKHHLYAFYCYFGCVIDFRKEEPFEPTAITLIFPKQWDFSSYIHQETNIFVASNPGSTAYLQIGSITFGARSIEQEMEMFKQEVETIIAEQKELKRKSSDAKNHHTPTWLLEVSKEALKKFSIEGQSQPSNATKGQKKEVINSKGGTLDVGQHTGTTRPNTTFQIVKSYLNYLIEDEDLTEVLMVDYKLGYLESVIFSLKGNITRIQDSVFKQCLKGIINELKKLTNSEIKYNQENAQKIITRIYRDMSDITPLGNDRVAELRNLISSVYDQQRELRCFRSIHKCDEKNVTVQKTIGNLGFSSPLQIANNFSTLLTNFYEEAIWILLVEKFFWKIAKDKLGPQNVPIQIGIHEIQCDKNAYSIMHQIINKYRTIISSQQKAKKYGMMLKNQAYAHLYLIQLIGAAVAFEVVKNERKGKLSNLNNYTIPQNIHKLYSMFYSLSLQGRYALQSMVAYFTRNSSKKQIFCLDGTSKSYYQYAIIITQQNNSIKDWKRNKKIELDNAIALLNKQIQSFASRYEIYQKQKTTNEVLVCNCEYHWVQYSKKKKVYELKKCPKCIELDNITLHLNGAQKEQGSQILAPYPRNDIDFYAFLYNIPQDLLGMIKIIYQSQIQRLEQPANTQDVKGNYFKIQYAPMIPFSPGVKISKFLLSANLMRGAEEFVRYPQNATYNLYHLIKQKAQISPQLMHEQKLEYSTIGLRYQFMLNKPEIRNSKREHQCYSRLYSKGKDEKTEEFLSYSNLRVSEQAQLLILTEKLKNREICFKTLIDYAKIKEEKQQQMNAKMLIILRTVADINAYRIMDGESSKIYSYPMIEECISDLITNYLKMWKFEDLYSLHIIGIVFSLFSMEINHPEFAVNLAMKAYEQYQKYASQNKVANNILKSQLSYFLHGAMACYTESVTQRKDKDSVETWTILQILFRINKVFSDQNIKDPRYRTTMIHFDFFRTRAIFQNVDNVKEYFIKHPQRLTKIIQIIDKDIPVNIVWSYNKPKGEYVFSGAGDNKVYDLNLYSGILLKNNCELAGLPEAIKQNQRYIEIFDRDRDLEIYPEADGSLRTRCNFAQFFPNQPETIILFQFKKLKKRIILKMIIKRRETPLEKKYVLVEEDILDDSDFVLPVLYKKQYHAWYCESENHIVFRKKKLNEMKEIGLILLTEKKGQKLYIVESRIIENKFKKESLEWLKLPKNSDFFDFVKLFPKRGMDLTHNLAFEMFSAIELPDYIIQVEASEKEKEKRKVKFWLHRYNLRFTFSLDYGLLSDNYQGYAVSQRFNNHRFLPWGSFERVHCLILKKTIQDLKFAKNHDNIVLIPDVYVTVQNQKDKIPLGETFKMNAFSYQIHDYFKDLRSKRKIQQLHLACLVSSTYFSNFSALQMNNEEYALSILRSCINPVPLTQQEFVKLGNILTNAIQLNQISLILMVQALFQASNILKFILPFNKSNVQQKKIEDDMQTVFSRHAKMIVNCKAKYRTDDQAETLPIRKRLNETELTLLGMKKHLKFVKSNKKQSRWQVLMKKEMSCPQRIDEKISQWKDKLSILIKNLKEIIKKPATESSKDANTHQNTIKFSLHGTDRMVISKSSQIQSSLESFNKLKSIYSQITINKNESKNISEEMKYLLNQIQEIRARINLQIISMQKVNQFHLDFLSGVHKVIVERDFTRIMTDQDAIYEFYPDIQTTSILVFKKLIQLWMKYTTFQGSLQRIILILQDKDGLDKISLLREIQSPRQEIGKVIPWICFELEMKTQIWLSQFETFKLLEGSPHGSVTQLNMGEGKTQIIIPMLVLYEIYLNKKYLPRVNILSPLYKEAQDNYFKFFSVTGFRINIVPIYFNRSVQISQNNLNQMQYVINLFKKRSIILIDRDSSLSLILKLREVYGFKSLQDKESQQKVELFSGCNQKDKWMFRDIPIFDIFDEVDALMTPKKSFVYSVGNSTALPDGRIRFEYIRIFIQILLKQMLDYVIDNGLAVLEQCIIYSKQTIKMGGFSKGLRFLSEIGQEKIMRFRNLIIGYFLNKYSPPEFQFLKSLTQPEKALLTNYLIDSSISIDQVEQCQNIPDKVFSQIYTVRGIIAYGVLEHCLSLRCGVDYGVPGKQNLKRVGVPYEAADVPSKRSEYSHPEVATILSYLSYFNRGLTYVEFQEALKTLSRLSESSQQYYYTLWFTSIEEISKRPTSVKDALQINQQSILQKEELFKCYRYCRNTIVFWLVHCVFCNDLAQFNKSITASSWDIADSANSVGFSGTRDSKQSLPTYIKQLTSQNHEINGTDGKMIELMLEYTNDVITIVENTDDLWKRFCQTALSLKVGCIIDAGAILAGKSLEQVIVPWISLQDSFKRIGYRGISFCNENGVWKVYDNTTHTIIERQTSIPEHQTFVIFDEARTRGADMKMKNDVKAALSLGPNMPKDKLMQAVGRLRKFGRNQSIFILSTQQNYSKIHKLNLKEAIVKEKIKVIIEWSCINSINDNKRLLFTNSKLGWIHFKNAGSDKVSVEQFDPSLEAMYKDTVKYETVANLNDEFAADFKKNHTQNKYSQQLVREVSFYGSDYKVRCQELENVCEREVEMIEETEKERQKQLALLTPEPENNIISKYEGIISTMNIQLAGNLQFSLNFIKCTVYSQAHSMASNQLSEVHFVLVKPQVRSMIAITQREFSISLLKGVDCLGPTSLNAIPQDNFLVRFKDLSTQLPFIKKYNLENALTSLQFFNGQQNFEMKQLLLETIKQNLRRLKHVSAEQMVCHFVDRRRIKDSRYYCSHLESIYKQIISSQF